MAAYQYVYVMKDVTKAFPGGREVFKGITLSFLPGVKIGLLGVNGAGKSTLMKIMAGVETEYGGEAWAAEGVKVGYLEQEPHLDENLTVAENVMLAFGDLKAAIDRFNEISMLFAEEMTEEQMNDLLAEQSELQEKIDAEAGSSTAASRSRSTRCAVRRRIRASTNSPVVSAAASPSAACCLRSQTCCCSTNRPTIWMPSRWRGWKKPCVTMRAPSSSSPMIATSWRT